jgi:hypothetical protein
MDCLAIDENILGAMLTICFAGGIFLGMFIKHN